MRFLPHKSFLLLLTLSCVPLLKGANYTFSDSAQFAEVFTHSSAALHPVAIWSNAPGYDGATGRINLAAPPSTPVTLTTNAPVAYSSYIISFEFLAKEYTSVIASSLKLFLHSQDTLPTSATLSLVKTASSQTAAFQVNGGTAANGISLSGSVWYCVTLSIIRQDEATCTVQATLSNLNTGQDIASANGALALTEQENILSIILDNQGGGALALDNLVIAPYIDFNALSEDERLIYALAEDYSIESDGKLSTEGDNTHLPKTEIIDDETLGITFTPRQETLTYEVQYSTDLINWTSIGYPAPTTNKSITIESPLSISEAPRQFLRLRISNP